MEKFLLICILIISLVAVTKAQDEGDYFITQNGDTTFCTDVQYVLNGGKVLAYFEYKGKDGKKVKLRKGNVPPIITFKRYSDILDKIPLNPEDSGGREGFVSRWAKGKIKMYYAESTIETRTEYGSYQGIGASVGGGRETSPGRVTGFKEKTRRSGIDLFTVKMPDGKFYNVTPENMDKIIKPYIQKCEAFMKDYKGDYTLEKFAFTNMLKTYNTACK
jgi:hypothetical protein